MDKQTADLAVAEMALVLDLVHTELQIKAAAEAAVITTAVMVEMADLVL